MPVIARFYGIIIKMYFFAGPPCVLQPTLEQEIMPYGVNPLQSYQVYDADIFAIDGMEVRRIVFPRQKVHFDDDTVEPCDDRHCCSITFLK